MDSLLTIRAFSVTKLINALNVVFLAMCCSIIMVRDIRFQQSSEGCVYSTMVILLLFSVPNKVLLLVF